MPTKSADSPTQRYTRLQQELAAGWNTWDVYSMVRHVLLPQGLCVSLGFKDYATGRFLAAALTGRHGDEVEHVRPGPRSYDGRYTSLTLDWSGIQVRIESCADNDGLIVIVTPLSMPAAGLRPKAMIIGVNFLWNQPGSVRAVDADLVAVAGDRTSVQVTCDGDRGRDRNVPFTGAYVVITLGDRPITICAGRSRSAPDALACLATAREQTSNALMATVSGRASIAEAVQSALAWNTIFEPDGRRVISPVSRVWSCNQGGWVLFCWDTYFAALLAAATGNRELAYANLVEITRHATESGFVPNTTNGHGFVTLDRSQPPVGAITLLELYRQYHDEWIVELVFDALVKWNRWWPANRRSGNALAWGSNAYAPVVGNEWETPEKGVGRRFGGSLESGMDNSPAYDECAFDTATSTLALEDVGLTSLYVADCEALAELASVIGRVAEQQELLARAGQYRTAVRAMWCDDLDIFACRSTTNGEFIAKLTPTNFYPLLLEGLVTPLQAERMLKRYFDDATYFGGEWLLPSCPRNDPAFAEQHYWRGRIWPPHVYLVWQALRRSGQRERAERLAENASAMLEREWRLHGHVHENYSAVDGHGCGYRWSDPLYHWGALLGLPSLSSKG